MLIRRGRREISSSAMLFEWGAKKILSELKLIEKELKGQHFPSTPFG
jgi:hypothetical protein